MLFAEVVGAVDVAGGAALGADHLLAQVVQGDVGTFGNDNHLHAGGIGLGEVHDQQAVIVDGQTSHNHVGLAFLSSQQGSVKVHVVDLQLQAQLLSDGGSDLDVDAFEAAGVGGHLIGRECSVGGHGQHAFGDGGEGGVALSGLGDFGAFGLGSGLFGAAAGGQGTNGQQHGCGHQDGKKLLHRCNLISNFVVPPGPERPASEQYGLYAILNKNAIG